MSISSPLSSSEHVFDLGIADWTKPSRSSGVGGNGEDTMLRSDIEGQPNKAEALIQALTDGGVVRIHEVLDTELYNRLLATIIDALAASDYSAAGAGDCDGFAATAIATYTSVPRVSMKRPCMPCYVTIKRAMQSLLSELMR